MKTISKPLLGILTIFCLFLTAQVLAQDRYGYVRITKFNQESKTQYLIISDPVKNWYFTSNGETSDTEKEAWNTNFRTQAIYLK